MKLHRSILFTAAVLALVASCTPKGGPTDGTTAKAGSIGEWNGVPLEKIPVVATFKYPDDFAISTSREQIEARWGKPLQVNEEKLKSPYDADSTDVRYELVYDGFSFRIYSSSAREQELLVATTITDPKYAISSGLRVGMYKERVLADLGTPTFVEGNSYVYASAISSSGTLNKELEIPNGVVTKINVYPEIP